MVGGRVDTVKRAAGMIAQTTVAIIGGSTMAVDLDDAIATGGLTMFC